MKTMNKNIRQTKTNESGIVAILVVIVFSALLAVISIGFSHLMNREARQALDRQLSLQAYYSAESGVNDSKAYLKANPSAPASNGCKPPSGSPTPFVTGGDISGDGVAKYSCVIINPSPNELTFTVGAGESKVFKINVTNLSNMYLSWQNQGSANPQPLSAYKQLPREDQITSADTTGILRTGIYPVVKTSGTVSNANAVLTAISRSFFMYPDAGGGNVGSITMSASDDGGFAHGNCNQTHPANYLPYKSANSLYCNSKITGLDGTTYSYYVRLTALYAPLNVSLQVSNSANANLTIPNVEGIVDVTGAGNDVISRVQARVPLGGTPFLPSYGIQSMAALCKGFRVPADSATNSGQPFIDGSIPNSDPSSSVVCQKPFNAGAFTGTGIPPYDDVPCGTNALGSPGSCVCPAGWTGNANIQCDPPTGGGGGGGGGGGCVDPPGCPATCGGNTCATKVATVTVCLFDDGSFSYPATSSCKGFGGNFAQGCLWSDGHVELGAC